MSTLLSRFSVEGYFTRPQTKYRLMNGVGLTGNDLDELINMQKRKPFIHVGFQLDLSRLQIRSAKWACLDRVYLFYFARFIHSLFSTHYSTSLKYFVYSLDVLEIFFIKNIKILKIINKSFLENSKSPQSTKSILSLFK